MARGIGVFYYNSGIELEIEYRLRVDRAVTRLLRSTYWVPQHKKAPGLVRKVKLGVLTIITMGMVQ